MEMINMEMFTTKKLYHYLRYKYDFSASTTPLQSSFSFISLECDSNAVRYQQSSSDYHPVV